MRARAFTLLLLAAQLGLAQRLALDLATPGLIAQRLDAGVTKQKLRQSAIAGLFADAGCTTELQKVSGYSANVICSLPGETESTVTVGGHYDFVERGQGVVDDWTGASLLPTLYQSLKSQPRHHTFVFVAFSGEEDGLWGSKRYVSQIPKEQRAMLRAYVNLECLGVGIPRVWATRANTELMNRLAETADALKIQVSGMSLDRVGDDDSHPFLDLRIPVITIHSLTSDTFPILHSARDNRKAIDLDKLYDAYRLTAFYLANLDSKLQP